MNKRNARGAPAPIRARFVDRSGKPTPERVRRRLQAALYHARKRRKARQSP